MSLVLLIQASSAGLWSGQLLKTTPDQTKDQRQSLCVYMYDFLLHLSSVQHHLLPCHLHKFQLRWELTSHTRRDGWMVNHGYYYPKPACCTENSVKQAGGWYVCPTDWERVIASPVIPNKDGTATDSCFALIGAHQRGVLKDVLGWLAAHVSTTSTRAVISGYCLQTDARLRRRLTNVTLDGIVEWVITGSITPYQPAALKTVLSRLVWGNTTSDYPFNYPIKCDICQSPSQSCWLY